MGTPARKRRSKIDFRSASLHSAARRPRVFPCTWRAPGAVHACPVSCRSRASVRIFANAKCDFGTHVWISLAQEDPWYSLFLQECRVGALSDSTVGLVSRLPSRMCWVGVLCCGISFLGRLGAGDASCRHEVLRRGAVLLASRTQRAFVAFVGERRRSAAGARHGFSRAVRRVERRDVVDAFCGEGW